MNAPELAALKAGKEEVPSDVVKFTSLLRKGAPPHAYALLVGIEDLDSAKILRLAQEGLAYHAFERFQRNAGLSQLQLASLMQIAARTLTRRRAEGRFHPDESDRLLRASRVFGRALSLFDGDRLGARNWLVNPQPALGGAIPLTLIETEFGAREVESVIGRIEHGVYS